MVFASKFISKPIAALLVGGEKKAAKKEEKLKTG